VPWLALLWPHDTLQAFSLPSQMSQNEL
jgi:hypothetical protein